MDTRSGSSTPGNEELVGTLPTLTTPIHGEALIMYLTASTESVNAILFTRRENGQLYTDGASSSDGSGTGLMLIDPEGKEYTYALCFKFKTTNNKAEYKALLAGLRIASYTIEHVRRNQNKKADALSKLALITFEHLTKEVLVEVLARRTLQRNNQKETPFSLTYSSEAIIPTVKSIVAKDGRESRKEVTKRRESKEVALIEKAYYQSKLQRYHSKRNNPSN
ncbi:reverse transcriptase domain-containing protein [Tanacetum coccineum]